MKCRDCEQCRTYMIRPFDHYCNQYEQEHGKKLKVFPQLDGEHPKCPKKSIKTKSIKRNKKV